MRHNRFRGFLGVSLAAVLVVGVCGVACRTTVAASSIAQGFKAGGTGIAAGALVSLQEGTPNSVELSTLANRTRLTGVAGKQSLLEFVNGNPIQVVTTGATTTLVSDFNGVVKAGDRVTASPIAGIGMKATESVMIIGTAQSDLDVGDTESRTITSEDGDKKTVRIGAVPVLVTPGFYQTVEQQSRFVPGAIQTLANSVAGRNVSPLRVMIAGLVVVLLFTAVAMLMYSSVRASIISIGRNPLSEQAVHKSLFEVGVTTIGVLAFTIIIVYLILTT